MQISGGMKMTAPELTWVILGHPLDPSKETWPATVMDVNSRRLRYQRIPKGQALETNLMGGMAKWSAHYIDNEWRLIEMVPDTATEAAL